MLDQLVEHPHVLWHAPTGFGKTVVVLTAMLNYLLGPAKTIDRIIIMVRMKTQIFRILDEAFTISSHYFSNYEDILQDINDKSSFPSEIISLPLIGKDELCINPHVDSSFTSQRQIDCKSLKCKYFKEIYPKGEDLDELILTYFMKDLKSTREIKEFLTMETPALCPYYTLKAMLKKAQIVVTTHAWLLNPKLAKSLFEELSIDPERTGIIIDEVHNFRAHQTGLMTYNQIKLASIFAFRNDLPIKDYLSDIEIKFRRHKLTKTTPLLSPEEEWILDNIEYVLNSYQGKRLPSEEDRKGLKALNRLHTFLSTEGNLWFFDKEEYFDWNNNKQYHKVIKRMLAFPDTVLNKIAQFKRIVLMSGTLYPPKAYMTLYGLDTSFQLVEVPHESRKIKYLTFLHPNLSSKQRNRSLNLFKVQSRAIKALHENNVSHTIVFSTSKAYTSDLSKVFVKIFPNIEVFQESSSQQNQIILEKLRLKRHELIFATLAGGFSEGVEIKDRITEESKITTIIFTGIPHPPPTLTQQLLEEKYLQKFGKRNTIFFLKWLPIYQTLLQAAGRGIRRPMDQCLIICLDYRLPGLNIFPKELSINSNEFAYILRKIQTFFNT
jgi:Rad3-related DNA helicase